MRDYILSCCSTADLDSKHFKDRNINYACFHFFIDEKEYKDDLGKTVSFEDFYKKMSEGAKTRTSQINSEEYVSYFKKFLDKEQDIVHVCLSSGLSGTYNSAIIASNQLKKEYPERKIYIIDSLGASSGYGLFMDKLADIRDEGKDAKTLVKWAEENKLRLNHWFFSTDLSYYVAGGRITKAAGWFGTILKICPLLNMNDEGKLIPRSKCMGKRKASHEIVKKMTELADGGLEYNGKCYISESAFMEQARYVADLIETNFKNLDGKVEINSIGTTIGSHTGPGTIAIFFWGKKREN